MAELLLELLSEEIPARMQARAAEDLKRLVTDGLKKAGLDFESAKAFVTPRRLALVVDGLPKRTPDISEERRGPRADAPEQAVIGFKGSLPEGTKVETRETEKGEFYFALVKQKGGPVRDLLEKILGEALSGLGWPKSMCWANNKIRWVRPIKGIVCMFGGSVVEIEYGPVMAGNTTTGHRFLSSGSITVSDSTDYKAKLEKAHVILDAAERRALIEAEAAKLAKKAKLNLKGDPALLDEVAGLVEWPVVHMGSIDKDFMDLPPEVLTTSMRKHQKYFALEDSKGKLAPKFIVVANTETSDGGKVVVAGNERVLRARLADAKFFWDQDRKTRLEDRLSQLEKVIFHDKLGAVAEKVERIQHLARDIALFIPGADKHLAERAAQLCKADLVTGMVVEFTNLQGVMGGYYALAQGEEAEVAQAITDHYSPAGPNDKCPTEPVSIVVALADKIDSLVCFFGINEKPTGSKDPFALRRAALGVIRLILENNFRIPLHASFGDAVEGYGDHPGAPLWDKDKRDSDEVADDLLSFFADRLKVHLREQGVPHDHIDAVFALGGEDDLVRLLARVEALGAFLKTEDGGNLLVAYRRAANILRIEEKKDGQSYSDDPDEGLLQQDEEKALFESLGKATPDIDAAITDERFDDAMARLAQLREGVDFFFDAVTVNCDDPDLRVNRLRLLSKIRRALDQVADFSKIEGGEK